jgi:hypothetical protein
MVDLFQDIACMDIRENTIVAKEISPNLMIVLLAIHIPSSAVLCKTCKLQKAFQGKPSLLLDRFKEQGGKRCDTRNDAVYFGRLQLFSVISS